MQKIDYKKELKHLYGPNTKTVVWVDVPPRNFLMIDGKGDPNTSQEYQHAIEALFALSYNIKFMIKKGPSGIDYGVMPLEGLWWAEDMSKFSTEDKSNWLWTMMMMQPEVVSEEIVASATQQVKKKKDPPALSRIRFESFTEGKAAQIMHIGPFTEEGPTIERVHQFIWDSGHELGGKHHEIYLSDIRKADPSKWRTVIRQPIKK